MRHKRAFIWLRRAVPCDVTIIDERRVVTNSIMWRNYTGSAHFAEMQHDYGSFQQPAAFLQIWQGVDSQTKLWTKVASPKNTFLEDEVRKVANFIQFCTCLFHKQ